MKISGMSPEESAGKLLLEEKVGVVPGSLLTQCGQRYDRCCYAHSLSEIEEAPKRMGRLIDRHCQKIAIGNSYLQHTRYDRNQARLKEPEASILEEESLCPLI